MKEALNRFTGRFCREENGQDLVEYALLLALLAVAATTTLGPLATAISNLWTSTTTQLSGS